MAFLDETLRVRETRRAGDFETPNPETFWWDRVLIFDPTHRNPLPGRCEVPVSPEVSGRTHPEVNPSDEAW